MCASTGKKELKEDGGAEVSSYLVYDIFLFT